MLSDTAGAYFNKIPGYVPMYRQCGGLLRQNPWLRPDVLTTTGLIPAKSLTTTRWHDNDGAYSGKIPGCAPMARRLVGIIDLVLPPIPAPTQIHKNTDRQISSLSISIFVCQYLFRQRSITVCLPSHPGTPAAFPRKEPW